MLPAMTTSANAAINSATAISTDRGGAPAPRAPSHFSLIGRSSETRAHPPMGPQARRRLLTRQSSLAGQEPGLFHQRLVALLFRVDPLGILFAGHEGIVEGALVHQRLPLGSLAHLFEQVDVVVNLVLGSTRHRENTAQHQVLDVETLRLARRNFAPGHIVGDLVGVRESLAVEHAKRPYRITPPLRHRLDRIVDGRVDVFANQLDRDLAAAAEWNIGELGAGGLLDGGGDIIVLLFRAGTAN